MFPNARMEVGRNKQIGRSIVAIHILSLLDRIFQYMSVCVKSHIIYV